MKPFLSRLFLLARCLVAVGAASLLPAFAADDKAAISEQVDAVMNQAARAGMPVLARVAAILWAIIPDLPTPVTTTLPEAERSKSTAASKAGCKFPQARSRAEISLRKTTSACE